MVPLTREFGGIDTLYIVFGALWTQSLLGVAGTDPHVAPTMTGPTRAGLQTVSDCVRTINDANITGTALVLSALLPRLQTNSKAPYVCVVGSLASLVPAPTRSMYCATKCAQQMLVQSVAIECASQAKVEGYVHVPFVVLAPSTVQTSFRTHMALTQGPHPVAPKQTGSLHAADVAQLALSCVERGTTGVVPLPRKYFWVWLLSPLMYVISLSDLSVLTGSNVVRVVGTRIRHQYVRLPACPPSRPRPRQVAARRSPLLLPPHPQGPLPHPDPSHPTRPEHPFCPTFLAQPQSC